MQAKGYKSLLTEEKNIQSLGSFNQSICPPEAKYVVVFYLGAVPL